MIKNKLQNLLADLQIAPQSPVPVAALANSEVPDMPPPSAEGFQQFLARQPAPAQEAPDADMEEVRQLAQQVGMGKARKAASAVPGPSAEAQPAVVEAAASPAAPLAGFNPEMDDAALSRALDEKRQLQQNAMLARATDSLTKGAMLGTHQTPQDNTAMLSALDAFASGATDKVETRRKGMQQEESFKQDKAKSVETADMLAKADPNSDISKSVREFAKKMGFNPPENVSVNQMQSILPLYEKYQSRQDTLVDKKEARADKLKAEGAKRGEGMTEGRKAADKDYAKDFNDFTGGGETKAKNAIAKLEQLKDEMSKDTGLIQAGGGPIAGSLPDAMRSEKSIARRDNIVSTANSALKATFGGQLSDGERKALATEFYNDKLSNAENMKVIERKIQEMKSGLQIQKAKAEHFAQKGTLTGFKGPESNASDSASKPKTVKQNGHTYTLNEATGEYE